MAGELFTLRARLRNPATSVGDSDSGQSGFSDLKSKLADLSHKSEAKESSPERGVARRVLNQYLITFLEESRTLIQTKKYDLAISNLAFDAQLLPDNTRLLYNLTCAYALKGDKRRAIETLGKAVQKGFANVAELERNSQLDTIRDEAGFKKLVEEMKRVSGSRN